MQAISFLIVNRTTVNVKRKSRESRELPCCSQCWQKCLPQNSRSTGRTAVTATSAVPESLSTHTQCKQFPVRMVVNAKPAEHLSTYNRLQATSCSCASKPILQIFSIHAEGLIECVKWLTIMAVNYSHTKAHPCTGQLHSIQSFRSVHL